MFGLVRFVLAAAIAFSVTAALRQWPPSDYPNRPIKLIVAFPPGGATDVIARMVGQPLGARLGQQVIVDNRPGSNGNIAAEVAAKARPDGYTLMIGSDACFGINPHLYAKMPVDPPKEFVPVTNLVSNQLVLAVNPTKRAGQRTSRASSTSPSSAKPPLFYASIGNGSQHHLAMEMLKQQRRHQADARALQGRRAGRHRHDVGRSRRPCSAAARWCRWSNPASCARSRSASASARPCCPTCRPSPNSIRATRSRSGRACSRPTGTPEAIIDKLRTRGERGAGAARGRGEAARHRLGRADITTPEEFAGMIRRDYESTAR